MLNMIKMDIYRMFRTKSLWIIWAIMAVALLYTTKLSLLDYERINQVGQETTAEDISQGNINIGMSVLLPTEAGEEVTVYDVIFANISAKFLGVVLAIFAVIFSTADIHSGYAKHIAGQVKRRGNLVISKAVALSLFVVITLFGAIIVQVISNLLIYGKAEWGSITDFAIYMGTQVVLHIALVMIIMAISVILKNNLASMTIAICMCMNMMVIFYSGVDKLMEKIGIKEFQVFPYTVTGKIAMLPMDMTGKDCAEGIGIALLFSGISIALASYVFQKRDIS
uniref:ABC transporter permease subunit n=1 Tax=Agathobacter sp. TaxID=2021311 RepID=UPI00405656AB